MYDDKHQEFIAIPKFEISKQVRNDVLFPSHAELVSASHLMRLY